MQRSEMIDSIHHSIYVKLLLTLLITLVIDSKKMLCELKSRDQPQIQTSVADWFLLGCGASAASTMEGSSFKPMAEWQASPGSFR
jgi:hypothetical protein